MIRHHARRDRARLAAVLAAVLGVTLWVAPGAGRALLLTAGTGQPSPANVRGLVATQGNRSVTLAWQPAEDPSVIEYVVTRAKMLGPDQGGATVVYRGPETEFTDRGLRNGVRYRYAVFTLDQAGNTPAGVVVTVTPRAPLLARPGDGERVEVPVELTWVPTKGAAYYNVQVFRLAGRDPVSSTDATKVLSAWPANAHFTLGRAWTYGGRAEELRPGRYVWYVWPGLGPRAQGRYGKLLGRSVFVVPASKAVAG